MNGCWPCQNCGASTDTGCCSPQCARALENNQRLRRLERGECPDCGRKMSNREREEQGRCNDCSGDE